MGLPPLGEGTIITVDMRPNITGDFSRFTGQVRLRARSLKPWFTNVMLPLALEMHQRHFSSQGAYGGDGDLWAEDYSDGYQKWKMKKVKHLTKEVLSGRLKESLTRKTRYTLVEIRRDSFVFGSKARNSEGFVYVGVQQGVPYIAPKRGAGGSKSAKSRARRGSGHGDHIPPRPPIVREIPAAVVNEIGESIVSYIAHGIFDAPRA